MQPRDGLIRNRWVMLAIVIMISPQTLFTDWLTMHTHFHSAPLDAPTRGRIPAFGGTLLVIGELEMRSARKLEPR